jgi:hypothetical protein
MEIDQLDDALAHIESASPEQLRTALQQVSQDNETLAPLLATAAPRRSPSAGGATWLSTMRQPKYVVLAAIALIAGLGIGGLFAERAFTGTPGTGSLTSTAAPASAPPVRHNRLHEDRAQVPNLRPRARPRALPPVNGLGHRPQRYAVGRLGYRWRSEWRHLARYSHA